MLGLEVRKPLCDEGRIVLNVITTISQWERERIGERVSDMHKVKAARGERVGKPPYGYKVGADRRSLIKDRDEQKTIKRITRLRSDGASYQRIAETLDEEGHPSRGSRWHPTTVARIVKRHGGRPKRVLRTPRRTPLEPRGGR